MNTLMKLNSTKGITLLEVMVAVAIASIALVSLVSLVSSSITLEDNARKVTDATVVADNLLKEIEREGYPEIGFKEALVDEDDPTGFVYRQTVAESAVENVRAIRLDVLWNNMKNSVTLTMHLAKR